MSEMRSSKNIKDGSRESSSSSSSRASLLDSRVPLRLSNHPSRYSGLVVIDKPDSHNDCILESLFSRIAHSLTLSCILTIVFKASSQHALFGPYPTKGGQELVPIVKSGVFYSISSVRGPTIFHLLSNEVLDLSPCGNPYFFTSRNSRRSLHPCQLRTRRECTRYMAALEPTKVCRVYIH